MNDRGGTPLYTPELLGLAVTLADYPLDPALPLVGRARSRSCGSTLTIGLECNAAGRVARLGAQVTACAVGQAAAALFVASATGADRSRIETALGEMERWLTDGGDLPDWPEIDGLARARDYPGRHGAMLLPWKAALDALSNGRGGG